MKPELQTSKDEEDVVTIKIPTGKDLQDAMGVGDVKPKLSYSFMIGAAIVSAPKRMATFNMVLNYIIKAFPYYAKSDNKSKLQAAVNRYGNYAFFLLYLQSRLGIIICRVCRWCGIIIKHELSIWKGGNWEGGIALNLAP